MCITDPIQFEIIPVVSRSRHADVIQFDNVLHATLLDKGFFNTDSPNIALFVATLGPDFAVDAVSYILYFNY